MACVTTYLLQLRIASCLSKGLRVTIPYNTPTVSVGMGHVKQRGFGPYLATKSFFRYVEWGSGAPQKKSLQKRRETQVESLWISFFCLKTLSFVVWETSIAFARQVTHSSHSRLLSLHGALPPGALWIELLFPSPSALQRAQWARDEA